MLLSAEHLSINFGSRQLLDDVNFYLNEGDKTGIIGINGTGKTTAIAKIANRLMKDDKTIVLAAGDTFRAGAIEQLTIHADKLGCKIVKHSQDATCCQI